MIAARNIAIDAGEKWQPVERKAVRSRSTTWGSVGVGGAVAIARNNMKVRAPAK